MCMEQCSPLMEMLQNKLETVKWCSKKIVAAMHSMPQNESIDYQFGQAIQGTARTTVFIDCTNSSRNETGGLEHEAMPTKVEILSDECKIVCTMLGYLYEKRGANARSNHTAGS